MFVLLHLSELLQPYVSSQTLRLADRLLLSVLQTTLKLRGDQTFSALSPTLWNKLPQTLNIKLFTHSFQVSFKSTFFSVAFSTVWVNSLFTCFYFLFTAIHAFFKCLLHMWPRGSTLVFKWALECVVETKWIWIWCPSVCTGPFRQSMTPSLALSLFLSLLSVKLSLSFPHLCVCSQQAVCEEMVRELQGIILCRDSLQVRRRRSSSMMRSRPLPLEERRARAAAMSLSNGKLCGGTGLPEPFSHRLAQEAALVARGCSHIRICPECRRFQGLRMRPVGATGALPSPTHSEESIEWDKTSNSSEPE